MYAVHTYLRPLEKKVAVPGVALRRETVSDKHLVESIAVSATAHMSSDEDSFGNQSSSADITAGFIVAALCGVTFSTEEISMFGDADLCEKCADICKNLPRYVR